MRIGVNTRLLIKDKLDGMGWFSFEVLSRWVKNHPDHEFVFFFDRPWDEAFVFGPNVTPVRLRPQARHPILFHWWFNKSIKRALKQYKCDLFFSPDGYMSLTTQVPQLAVFHDLNFEHHPEYLPKHIVKFYTESFPKYAQKARHIVAVSAFTKQDVQQRYGIPSEKISVALNGFNSTFTPLSETAQEQVRLRLTAGTPYFICPGSIHPRKNIARLINAYTSFRKEAAVPYKLVLAGAKMWWTEEMSNAIQASPYATDILQTGRISQADMTAFIASATAVVYPSVFEGFGLPILEGFASGVPVITSTTSSMPEVAGDAAILVDPQNTAEIANAMERMVTEKGLAERLVSQGHERLKLFSWDKTAAQIWDVIRSKF